MPKRPVKRKNSPRLAADRGRQAPTLVVGRFLRLPVLFSLGGIICLTVAVNLHSSWVALPWLAGIALWGYYFWSADTSSVTDHGHFPYTRLLVVLTAATIVRWFKISELPLGPYVDELFTLHNTIDLLQKPFDLFGQTPLAVEGWVETTNLYLYFNSIIVKLFGASYSSMKLFSVLPGIIACVAVFLIGRLIFTEQVAFWTALLFVFAHWPVRLSRYGWDVSFMIMTFALAIWLLLLALQRLRFFYAYLSGVTAGVCLYGYLGARICVLSLLAFLYWERRADHRQAISRHLFAFATGGTLVAFPLLVYYFAHPNAFWIRTAELSVLNSATPLANIIDSAWRHALMFFIQGGIYARDNYPGLAMLDPLSGIVFIVGLVEMLRLKNSAIRLTAFAFAVNFVPGIFSLSQEGAPYVYRTAAVMIPTFILIGLGLQKITASAEKYLPPKRISLLAWPLLLLIAAVNLYFYFDLEPRNAAAMRVMLYEPRVMGLEIARDNLPVYLVGADLLRSLARAGPGESYAAANPPMTLPAEITKLAVISFSGRYDLRRTRLRNFEEPNNIYFVEATTLDSAIRLAGQAKFIFRSANRNLRETIRKLYPNMSVREIPDIWGGPMFTVATIVNPSPDSSADKSR